MPVQINEIIIRAIITNDDKKHAGGHSPKKDEKGKEGQDMKTEILEFIDEVIKNKNER